MRRLWLPLLYLTFVLRPVAAAEQPAFEVESKADRLVITSGGKPVATYVFKDEKIPRPYYCDVYAPGGARVTRNHPPIKGEDLTDHEQLHPGIWLSFGDLGGADFWRNKETTAHVEFLERPQVYGDTVRFKTTNRYRSSGRVVCDEIAVQSIEKTADGYLFQWGSVFHGPNSPFYFGDQQEMGLGIRLHTPLSVAQGGEILNSDGLKNEKEAWGKQAAWCMYSGMDGSDRAGVLLIPDLRNFRPSWFHCRDYGMVTANPFGQNAFTGGEKSRVDVPAGKAFFMFYTMLIFQQPADRPLDAAEVYRNVTKGAWCGKLGVQ